MKNLIMKVLLTLAVISITNLSAEIVRTVAPAPTRTIAPVPTRTIAPAPTRTIAPAPTRTIAPASTRAIAPAPKSGKASSTSTISKTRRAPVVTPRNRPTRLVQPGIKPVMAPGIRRISLPSKASINSNPRSSMQRVGSISPKAIGRASGIKDSVKIQSAKKGIVGSTIKNDMIVGGSNFGTTTGAQGVSDGSSGAFSNLGKGSKTFDASLDGISGSDGSSADGISPDLSLPGKASASDLKAQGANRTGIYSAESAATPSAGVDAGADASTTTSKSTSLDKTDSKGNSAQSNVVETIYKDGSKMTDESHEENGHGYTKITYTDKNGKKTSETHKYAEGPDGIDGSGAADEREGRRILGVSTQQTVVNPTNKLTGDGYSPTSGNSGKGDIQQGGIIRDQGNINPGSEPATATGTGTSSGSIKTNVFDTLTQPGASGGSTSNGGR